MDVTTGMQATGDEEQFGGDIDYSERDIHRAGIVQRLDCVHAQIHNHLMQLRGVPHYSGSSRCLVAPGSDRDAVGIGCPEHLDRFLGYRLYKNGA
jgi:hypothetical protein